MSHDEEFATDLDHLIIAGLVDVDEEPAHEPDSRIRIELTERGRAESQTSAKAEAV